MAQRGPAQAAGRRSMVSDLGSWLVGIRDTIGVAWVQRHPDPVDKRQGQPEPLSLSPGGFSW